MCSINMDSKLDKAFDNELKAGKLQREIAVKFNVSSTTISQIKTGRCWSHLTGITYTNPYSKNPVEFKPISDNVNMQFTPEAV